MYANPPAEGGAVAEENRADPLGGAHVLLTGATGFLGQALLEKLLSSYPDTTVSLLVRGRGSSSGAARVAGLLRKPVFSRWRKEVGEDAAKAAFEERVRVVDADLGAGSVVLPSDITVVIHAASTVSFDPPIDRKSTRLNSSHVRISYAVFCLKKKKT